MAEPPCPASGLRGLVHHVVLSVIALAPQRPPADPHPQSQVKTWFLNRRRREKVTAEKEAAAKAEGTGVDGEVTAADAASSFLAAARLLDVDWTAALPPIGFVFTSAAKVRAPSECPGRHYSANCFPPTDDPYTPRNRHHQHHPPLAPQSPRAASRT